MRMLWAVILVFLAATVRANDSTAVLDAGGLVYTTNSLIRIDSETLSIAEKEVKVAYDFTNTGDKDITTLVAFPMPELSFGDETAYAIEPPDPLNWMGFRVWVDGQPVRPSAEVRARRFGVDVTAVLARHKIPLIPLASSGKENAALEATLNGLDAGARDELVRYGLADWTSQWGANNEPIPQIHWTSEVSFYWFQTFPAGKTVHVEHRYRPVPGYSFISRETLGQNYVKSRFCVDAAFRAGFERRLSRLKSDTMDGADIGYVLSTASNWLGPIGKFRLVIDRGDPGNLVSTCFSGMKAAGDGQLVFEQDNFQPDKNIRLLLVKPMQ